MRVMSLLLLIHTLLASNGLTLCVCSLCSDTRVRTNGEGLLKLLHVSHDHRNGIIEVIS